MKKISQQLISTLTLLTVISSCGKEEKNNTSKPEVSTPQEQVAVDGSNIDGFYQAKFQTLNAHIVGTIPGSASFTRKEDRLYVYLRLFAGAPKAWHMQAVYTGARCPTMSDDTNGDGTLDINEALAVVGQVLIPLDSDPSTQNSGKAFYPLGDLSGSYHYERIVNFKRFLNDLQSEDQDPDDNIAKLGPNTGLGLIGRVVMIQGISEETELPETVGTLERRRAFQTLPIACGTYQKIEEIPGEPYIDAIPGPVAEVDEDQDRPAPDGTSETPEGESSTTGGGTNDSDDGNGPVSDGEGRSTGTSSSSSSTTGGSHSSTSSQTSSSASSNTEATASESTSSSSSSSSSTGGTSESTEASAEASSASTDSSTTGD